MHSLRNASSVDENIDSAEVIDHILDRMTDGDAVANINPVEADVDSSLLAEFSSGLITNFLLHVKYRDAAHANLGERLCHVETETTASSMLRG